MNTCPQCATPLTLEHAGDGMYLHCSSCGGRGVTMAVLRRMVAREAMNEMWLQGQAREGMPGRACPSCGVAMQEVRSTAGAGPMRVDVCPPCMLLWFDAGEFEALPPAPPSAQPVQPELPPAAREALALAEVEEIGRRYQSETDNAAPDTWWQRLLGYLGMPVETQAPEVRAVPWLTWLIVAVVSIISLAVLIGAPQALHDFGMIPAEAWRYGGLTFITVFFLHGGVLHLVGNMYFLLIFGDNTEDYLGKARFALLLLAATIVGNIAHILGDPHSTMPCIGASGGIAGVMACYALAFPQARFSFFYFRRLRWFTMPAWGFMLMWVAMQILGAWEQVQGFSNVSALAHLGGVATGAVCWLFWRKPAQ